MLDLRRLQTLRAVVNTGSIKDAAAQLGYTPSAVSQQIAALQRETGSLLLEPAGRGVRATAAGVLLAEHATGLLDRAAVAERELEAHNAGQAGALRIVSFSTACSELVAPAIASIKAALPELRVTVRSEDWREALSLLNRGLIDVAIVEGHGDAPLDGAEGLVCEHLFTDPFRVLLPRDHPLASHRMLSLEDLAAEPWIDLRCEVDCCWAVTTAAFWAAGFSPTWVAEADDYWPAQGFVAAGLGLALVPSLAVGIVHAGVVVRRLEPSKEPTREVFAVTRAGADRSPAIREMLEQLRETASDLADRSAGAG